MLTGHSFWRRIAAVAGAVVLVAVPTAFELFGREWVVADNLPVRITVGIGWIVVALATAWAALRREETQQSRLDDIRRQQLEEDHQRLERAVVRMFDDFLSPGRLGVPPDYSFTVYLYDEDTDLLTPWWPVEDATRSFKTFRPGAGATGTAWARNDTVVVTDDAVSDATYGLTDEQQAFFRDYQAVAATPVLRDGIAVGALTAISPVNDHHFETSEAREYLRDLAAVVGALAGAVADIGDE